MVTPQNEVKFLDDVLLGHREAVDAAVLIGRLSQTFDDIIDKDVEPSNELLAMWFMGAVVELSKNDFYVRNIETIEPVLYTAMADYLASVKMEKGDDDHEKNLAFVLRNNLIAVVIHFARLVGGYKYGLDVSYKIRAFYHDEDLATYKGGL